MWPVPIVLGRGPSATLLRRSSFEALKVSGGVGRECPNPGPLYSLAHHSFAPRTLHGDFLSPLLDSPAQPAAAPRDAPVTSGPTRAPPPDSPTSLAPTPALAPPASQASTLSPSTSSMSANQALSSLKAVGPPPATPPRKHRGLLATQQAEPSPPSILVTPSEPKSFVPDTGTLTPTSSPQGVKPAPSSTSLYMVTSFVSAPPAPQPPAPEPPPEPTKVTVRGLSPAKEVVGSPTPESTTLRQGPPQKPYTFLEEKARQAAGVGRGRWDSGWDTGNKGCAFREQSRLSWLDLEDAK